MRTYLDAIFVRIHKMYPGGEFLFETFGAGEEAFEDVHVGDLDVSYVGASPFDGGFNLSVWGVWDHGVG